MTHIIEPATTGRSRCKACGRPIERGELRFGERRSSFGDSESTLWFHPLCAAYRRAEQVMELLGTSAGHDDLRVVAGRGVTNPRLAQLGEVSRAPTDRATCRHCRSKIEKSTWRFALVMFEEFRFAPIGFIHAACAREYFGTTDVLERAKQFTAQLSAADLEEISRALGVQQPPEV